MGQARAQIHGNLGAGKHWAHQSMIFKLQVVTHYWIRKLVQVSCHLHFAKNKIGLNRKSVQST